MKEPSRKRGERPGPMQPHGGGLPVTPPGDAPRWRNESEDLAVSVTFPRGERPCLGGGRVAGDTRVLPGGGAGVLFCDRSVASVF